MVVDGGLSAIARWSKPVLAIETGLVNTAGDVGEGIRTADGIKSDGGLK